MDANMYYLIGGIFLVIVLFEIFKRIDKKPMSIQLTRNELKQAEIDKKEREKRKKESETFYARAERVNWKIPRTYQQTVFFVFLAVGLIATFALQMFFVLLGAVALGLFYPYLQLKKHEEAYESEMPLRAEQAINAVEQQIHGDVPIFHALRNAIPYMQEPVKSAYQQAVDKVEKGSIPLERALEDVPQKLGVPQLEYFHMILGVAQETEEKPAEIIRDASDMLRSQQKQANRFRREVADSKSEMKMMFYLVVIMVGSFIFMLPEDQIPFAGSFLHRILDGLVIGLTAFTTWVYSKKIQAKNLFQ